MPPVVVDLLEHGRTLALLEEDPVSAYDQVAWDFYEGRIDAAKALAVLNDAA